MAVRLTITERGDPSSEYVRSFLQDRILIGRARSADICLPDMAVSTRHAEIRLKGNDYVIVDLASLNGTELDGKELVAHRPRTLKNGNMIGVANFRLTFELGVATGPVEPRDVSLRHARQMVARVLARSGEGQENPVLIVTGGPHNASRFELPSPPAKLVMGRGDEAEITIEDRDVSREHAEIVVEQDGIFVRDLDSRNGLFVEGQKVDALKLEPGGAFTVGNTTIALESSAERSLGAILEAPEEMTSSFAFVQSSDDPREQHARDPDPPEPADDEDAPASEPPPVGPSDPLIGAAAEADEPPKWRTTGELPRPKIDGGSDIGLIIIGAIIVLAAVAGLVYLFS